MNFKKMIPLGAAFISVVGSIIVAWMDAPVPATQSQVQKQKNILGNNYQTNVNGPIYMLPQSAAFPITDASTEKDSAAPSQAERNVTVNQTLFGNNGTNSATVK